MRVAGGQLQTSLLLPDPNFHLPYVSQFNLTVERKLPRNTALSLTYSGNRGIGLPFFSGINDARFPITSPLVSVDVGGGNFQPLVFDRVCRDSSDPICPNGALTSFSSLTGTASLAAKGIVIVNGVPHGYIALGPTGTSATSERTNERRPDPTNGRNVLLSNFARTYYNALQMKVTKTSTRGLTLSGWWTWSKTMDTGSEATFSGTDVNAPVGAVNPQRSLRGLSSFDQTHRVSISAVYELPWMKAQQGILGEFVGGWTISGVSTFASGLPFTVLAGYDVNFDGVAGDRPILLNPAIRYTSIDNGRPQTPCPVPLTAGRCFDTKSQLQLPVSAFLPSSSSASGDQLPVTPGQDFPAQSVARNSFFQQGQKNVDAAVAKSFRIREGMGLQLRMEFYNVFNRVTFGIPSRTLFNPALPLGRISGTANLQNYVNSARNSSSRMGQLAIRFVF